MIWFLHEGAFDDDDDDDDWVGHSLLTGQGQGLNADVKNVEIDMAPHGHFVEGANSASS
jgi:hypothetical protein